MASIIGEAVIGKLCEIAVEMAVEMAVEKLAAEASLVVNFRKDFDWLNRQLKYLTGFLQDGGEQSRQKEAVKTWLEFIRDTALHAEDIAEECAVESMYSSNTQSCALSCNQLVFRYRMGRKFKHIKSCIRSIIEEGNQLKLSRDVLSGDQAALPSTSGRVDWKRTSLLPTDSHPVGIESKVQQVLSLLENPARPIIAVVGMGGMGKTHLQHVFNTTKDRYEKSIWLSVSQFYSVSKLQYDLGFHLDLSEQIKDGRVSEQLAAELIHKGLQGKRCLIVLDDVWRATREDNLIGRLGLPVGNNRQCKVVVTTRNRDVCRNLNPQIYEMECLLDEDSWKLFCIYAFGEDRSPQHLDGIAREVVKECGNVPLAIITIAASMANITLSAKWESKLRQLKQVTTADDPAVDHIRDILKLSYDSLSGRLKACFAYLSFFPEDEEIECEYLIHLWIGEGFIPSGEEQWDTAWDCLYQLANLCLLQVWENKSLTKYCKIHDLLLDLAIYISRENKCVFAVEEAFRSMDKSDGRRRILLGKKDVDDGAISQSRPVCPTLLRTLSLCHNEKITIIPASFFRSMTVLRVLDLSYTKISTMPECVGNTKLLKVLNLRRTQIKEIPECVRHLRSLSFLDIYQLMSKTPSEAPSLWISELKCLQHLDCRFTRMPKGISKLLRTLRSEYLNLSIEEDKFLRLEDVGNMTQLEELWLNVNHESELKRMEEGILVQLVKMRRLGIRNKIRGMQGDTESSVAHMKSMKDVETLRVERFAVPSWICCLANLRELCLSDCHCSNYPELQTMHNLVSLYMYNNNSCRELPKAFGKSGGFPQLRIFNIFDFPDLEEFPELEDGAMACLEVFYLVDCPRVKKVGEGLELLKRLEEFDYRATGREEMRERLKKGGEDWTKIKAINVHFVTHVKMRKCGQ